MGKEHKHLGVRIMTFAALSALAFTFLYPIYFMFLNSFKSKTEYRKSAFALPESWNFDNYVYMLDQFELLRYFFNTILIAAVSISIMMLLAVIASYAFARLPFRGRGFIYLVNTFTGVILCNIAGGLPGAV